MQMTTKREKERKSKMEVKGLVFLPSQQKMAKTERMVFLRSHQLQANKLEYKTKKARKVEKARSQRNPKNESDNIRELVLAIYYFI